MQIETGNITKPFREVLIYANSNREHYQTIHLGKWSIDLCKQKQKQGTLPNHLVEKYWFMQTETGDITKPFREVLIYANSNREHYQTIHLGKWSIDLCKQKQKQGTLPNHLVEKYWFMQTETGDITRVAQKFWINHNSF